MIGLLQRVSEASVRVDGECIAAIGAGLLLLVGIQPQDDEMRAECLLQRVLGYRVFADRHGRMNRALRDTGGGLLLVPQFTLAADTRSGARASFSTAAPSAQAAALFAHLLLLAQRQHRSVASGRFGADMKVALVNDGPVTFWLEA